MSNPTSQSQPPNKKNIYLKTCTLKMEIKYLENLKPTYVQSINKNINLNLYFKTWFYNSLCHLKYQRC